MRFLFPFTLFFALSNQFILGVQHTFILQDVDTNEFLIQEGDISTQKSPYCSFNIFLSLAGFDTKTLQDPENPVWPYKYEYEDEYRVRHGTFNEKWRAPHSPKSWMQNSCVWYSQALTPKLGIETFTNYVAKFEYGNQDLAGDAGKMNGLTCAWIGSSLRISPLEQVFFINRLIKNELPVSNHAHECTKTILFAEELSNGLKLYGKTGGGDFANGRNEPKSPIRWFVGWVEKETKQLAFAYMIQATEQDEELTGLSARDELISKLLELY